MNFSQPVDPETPISLRISILRDALQEYIQKLEASKSHTSVTNEQYIKLHSRIKHVKMLRMLEFSKDADIDLGKLHDIKAVFEASWRPPAIGLAETEFRSIVAPILHPGYPSGVDSWYSSIDFDSSGFVDWSKLSSYLMTPVSMPGADAGLDVALLRVTSKSSMSGAARIDQEHYATLPFGFEQAPTGFRVERLAFHSAHDSYFAYCSDHNVREYSAESLQCIGLPHHGDGAASVDMKVSAERETLYVAQRSGYIFVYDTTGEKSRTGNLIRAMRVAPSNNGITVPLSVKKTLPYDPLRMRHYSTGVAGKKPTTVPLHVDLLVCNTRSVCSCQAKIPHSSSNQCSCRKYDFAQTHQIQCIEPSRGLWPTFLNRDPYVFVGMEAGYVALYPIDAGHARPTDSVQPPVAAWHPHTDWVTKIMVSTHHRELYGWLSSSLDASIQLMDLEKQTSKVTIIDQQEPGAEGGWLDGIRPVTSFDVSRSMPIIASCGHMRVVNIWSPLMRRKVSSFVDHKGAVIDVCFNDELYHIVSLGSDRTIRVWDLRTMRPLQVITDKERLKCEDPLASIAIDTKRHAIVAAAGGPYVWHDSGELRRRETGSIWFAGYLGHSDPVREIRVSSNCEHIVSSDGAAIRVWNTQGQFLRVIPISSRVTAIEFDSRARQLFVGTESGNVEVWSHFNAKKLRILVGKKEITALLHLAFQTDDTILHSMAVVAGGGHVKFYPDKNVVNAINTSSDVPRVDAAYIVDPSPRVQSENDPPVMTTCLALLSGSKVLAIGLSQGVVVLCTLFTQTGPQIAAKFGWKLPTATRPVSPIADGPTERPQSSPHAHQLWSKLVANVCNKEKRLGASKFTNFRHAVQQVLNLRIDSLFVLSQTFLLGLCGNGDAVIWYLGSVSVFGESNELEQVACFPASSQLGEPANAVMDNETFELFVADTQGIISIFDMSQLNRYRRTNALLTQDGRPVSRQAGEFHNDVGVRLLACWNCEVSSINALALLHASLSSEGKRAYLFIGCENCSILMIDIKRKTLVRVLGTPSGTPQLMSCQEKKHRFETTFVFRPASTESDSAVRPSTSMGMDSPLTKARHRFSGVFNPEWSGEKTNEDRLRWMSRRFPHLRDQKGRPAMSVRALRDSRVGDDHSQKASEVIAHVNASRERRAQTAHSTGYECLKLQDVSDVVSWRNKSLLSAVELGRWRL